MFGTCIGGYDFKVTMCMPCSNMCAVVCSLHCSRSACHCDIVDRHVEHDDDLSCTKSAVCRPSLRCVHASWSLYYFSNTVERVVLPRCVQFCCLSYRRHCSSWVVRAPTSAFCKFFRCASKMHWEDSVWDRKLRRVGLCWSLFGRSSHLLNLRWFGYSIRYLLG